MLRLWSDGMGLLGLKIYDADAAYATPPGIDATPFIDGLRSQAFYATQLEALDPETLRDVLREYGAWDADELADHDENLSRILWIACGDVDERPKDYPPLRWRNLEETT